MWELNVREWPLHTRRQALTQLLPVKPNLSKPQPNGGTLHRNMSTRILLKGLLSTEPSPGWLFCNGV